MKFRFLTIAAAVALLAACESAPETTATTGQAGTARPTTAAPSTGSGIVPGTRADFEANVGDRVFFALDKYDLAPEARATLDKQAAWLKKYGNTTLVVEGHADERGTREYNLALGERRANSVKNYLVSAGVPANRLKVISYGKEKPVALGSNEAAWSQNRRAVSVVQ